jgi:hypothetical protein
LRGKSIITLALGATLPGELSPSVPLAKNIQFLKKAQLPTTRKLENAMIEKVVRWIKTDD